MFLSWKPYSCRVLGKRTTLTSTSRGYWPLELLGTRFSTWPHGHTSSYSKPNRGPEPGSISEPAFHAGLDSFWLPHRLCAICRARGFRGGMTAAFYRGGTADTESNHKTFDRLQRLLCTGQGCRRQRSPALISWHVLVYSLVASVA